MTKEMFDRAKQIALKAGYSGIAEDFAQEACLALWSGRKATLNQLLIDFLRQTFGDNRHTTHKTVRPDVDFNYVEDTLRAVAFNDVGPDFDNLIADLDPLERSMIVLRYKWGMENEEIGHAFGLSYSRVSQIISDTQKVLRKRFRIGTLSINAN